MFNILYARWWWCDNGGDDDDDDDDDGDNDDGGDDGGGYNDDYHYKIHPSIIPLCCDMLGYGIVGCAGCSN